MRKTNIYFLFIIIPIFLSCGGTNAHKEEFPSSVEVYYRYNDCPWGWTGIVWYPPKDFLTDKLSKITLTDEKSLEFFNKLRLKSESDGNLNSFPGKIWFSAVIDYGTHKDTASISEYRVLYNDKAFNDSIAVFYYMSKIQETDSITFSRFDELFYYNDFYPILKKTYDKLPGGTPKVNIELNDKIEELVKCWNPH